MTQGVAARMRPKDARSMLRVSQAKLSKKADISLPTIIESEKGEKPIRLATAYALLNALNFFRNEQGMGPLSIRDIEWNISGED